MAINPDSIPKTPFPTEEELLLYLAALDSEADMVRKIIRAMRKREQEWAEAKFDLKPKGKING